MYHTKVQERDSNPFRVLKREKIRGPFAIFFYSYVPAILIFTTIRLIMLSFNTPILHFGFLDDALVEAIRQAKNYYLFRFG